MHLRDAKQRGLPQNLSRLRLGYRMQTPHAHTAGRPQCPLPRAIRS
jgi:hypothetical protein